MSHQVGQLPLSARRGQRGVLNVVLDIERAVVDPVRVVQAERDGRQAPAERRQQVHARRHQLPNQRRIQRASRRGFGVKHPQDAHVTLGAAIFHRQEQGIETCKLSHALIVVPGGRRPLVCMLQQRPPPLSNIRTFSTCSDSVQRMEPAWQGAHGESERRLWSTVVQKAAVELTEHAREISDAVTDYTKERLPDLFDNSEALEANRASTEASIRDFAEVLRSGADPVEAVKLPSATLDYARDGAQHGVLLTTLMRSYRLGHAATSRHLRAILANYAADADELTAATELCSAWLFTYVDAALCRVEDVYVTERERWIRSAAASQAEALSTILAGQPIDIDVAGRRLRHDLRRMHVAAVAWLDAHEEGRNTLALLEAAIRDIAAAIGTQRPLIQPLGTLSAAAWISTSSPVPSRVLDELRFRTATAPGVRVAIGEPARDIAGFRASHVEALEAQRIARVGVAEVIWPHRRARILAPPRVQLARLPRVVVLLVRSR